MNANAIGLSALSVGQRALDLIGHNIANAATPGYHRQRLDLSARVYDGVHGVGVEVQRVVRYQDQLLHNAVMAASSEGSLADARLDPEQQFEAAFTAAGTDQDLGQFFDTINQLSARPADPSMRRTVLADAGRVTNSLNDLVNGIAQQRAQIRLDVTNTINDINRATDEISKLNQQIAQIVANGDQPNDLIDHRDTLIDNLAQLVDVRVQDAGNGMVTVLAAGAPVVVGDRSLPLNMTVDPAGNLLIHGVDPNVTLNVTGGKLGGLLTEHNQALPGYLARLNEFAAALIRNVDRVQATGLGLNGPFTSLAGQRAAASTTLPLNQAGLQIPPKAGNLYISVTDLGSGNRTLVSVAIDPATNSLQDVANAINAATSGNVQAAITPGGTLDLTAAAGFAFDFAGRLPTNADNVVMNGTSIPTVTGTFNGSKNDTYTFQVVGNGTVGVTPGLSLEVRDSSNTLLATLNIGAGYTPGSVLDAANGIQVALSAGTTNAGSFSARVIAEPDTADILPALGLNTFFVGSDAATIAVRPGLAADPNQLAASRDGSTGDARNLERFAALRDQPLLSAGTRTFSQHLGDTAGAVGDTVRSLDLGREATTSLQSGLEQQEQALIGVDVNEEMVKLLEFQRLIQSGSKFLAVANASLDSIMDIIK